MQGTTEHSMNSQDKSRPIGCSKHGQRGYPFNISLTKVSVQCSVRSRKTFLYVLRLQAVFTFIVIEC